MDYQFESLGPTLEIVSLLFLFVFVLATVAVIVGIAALPGWVARRRNHPQAAAVNIGGWFGLPTGVLWVLAMVWAYVVDPNSDSAPLETENRSELEAQLKRLEAAVALLETQGSGSQQ